ncbi:MAG: hypothetical protein R3B90_10565 [Planctomycetaceae bacterium]
MADKGELRRPEVLRAAAERLRGILDPAYLFDGFGAQWLAWMS